MCEETENFCISVTVQSYSVEFIFNTLKYECVCLFSAVECASIVEWCNKICTHREYFHHLSCAADTYFKVLVSEKAAKLLST